ncbi:hypothetical protein [Sphingobium sp. YR768]|uniref:hypothetical protein n=1 Tax=Sphingobium sp. YR768 TaxID=1884365 RepID=UPI000B87342F|nr:hypothetical protein [Sphingobium sp. YR768]
MLRLERGRDVFHPDGHDDHGSIKAIKIGWSSGCRAAPKHHAIDAFDRQYAFIELADDANALVETYSFAYQRYLPEDAVTRKAIAGGVELGDQEFDMLIRGR